MVEPRIFYKKMDALLSKIGKELSNADYLYTIVKEIETTFGKDLCLSHGRIYEKSVDEFILISPLVEKVRPYPRIPIETIAIQFALRYHMYIFDNPDLSGHLRINHPEGNTVPVAFIIENHHSQWLLVFELRSGWIREEIEFCLNLVRTLLNYRLFSEYVQVELEQAVKIQKSLLPTSAPHISGYELAGYSQPAALVGGDFFDYFLNDKEELVFYIGDASGHGIPAALMARDAVIGLRMGLENQMVMKKMLMKLNSVINRSVYSTGFVSLFFAKITNRGDLYYVNAGHLSAFLIHETNIEELESTGLILGALPDILLVQSYTKLESGDLLVLYSDGIIERVNRAGDFYGASRLKQLLLKVKDKKAQEILEAIFLEVDEFGEGSRWDDDATIVLVKKSK